jgi:hypothetical protein
MYSKGYPSKPGVKLGVPSLPTEEIKKSKS